MNMKTLCSALVYIAWRARITIIHMFGSESLIVKNEDEMIRVAERWKW